MPALAGLLLSSSACTADRLAAPDEAEAVQRLADDRAEQPPEDAAPSYDAATYEAPPTTESKQETLAEQFQRCIESSAGLVRAVVESTDVRLDRERDEPVTDVHLRVTNVLRGNRVDSMTVTVEGGTFGERISRSSHVPEFHAGGDYLLALVNDYFAPREPRFPGYGFSAEIRGDELFFLDSHFPASSVGLDFEAVAP